MKTTAAIFLIALTLLTTTSFAAFTLTSPADNAYVNGVVTIEAAISPAMDGVQKDVTFTYTNGTGTYEIGNVTEWFSNFEIEWDTTGIDVSEAIITATVYNSSSEVIGTDEITGLTVDNVQPQISSVSEVPEQKGAVISFQTTEDVRIVAECGNTSSLSACNSTSSYSSSPQSITLAGLNENMSYSYRLIVYDRAGNQGVSSTFNFTTTTAAPTVTDRADGTDRLNHSWIYINATTDEETTAVVRYGESESLSQSLNDTSFVKVHTMTIQGLDRNTTYYYAITVCDRAFRGANCVTTDTYTINTPFDSTLPSIVNASVKPSPMFIGGTVNISAKISDLVGIMAHAFTINYFDGTSDPSESMDINSGSGTTSSPYFCSKLVTINKAGTHTVTITAIDNSSPNNVNNVTLTFQTWKNWTVENSITDSDAQSISFRNYYFGRAYYYNLTIFNYHSASQNFAVTSEIVGSNTSEWGSIYINPSGEITIPSGGSAKVEVGIDVPNRPYSNVTIRTTVQNVDDQLSKQVNVTMIIPAVSISLPKAAVSNLSNAPMLYWNNSGTKWLNISGVTATASSSLNDDSSVSYTCAILNYTNQSAVVATGSYSNSTCSIDVSSLSGGQYTLRVNATFNDTGHFGTNTTTIMIPSSMSITGSSTSATKGATFTIEGNIRYNSIGVKGQFWVKAVYSGSTCGPTSIVTETNGDFTMSCNSPTSTGSVAADLSVTGVWGMKAERDNALTISVSNGANTNDDSGDSGSRFQQITASVSSVNISSDKNISITLTNNYSSFRTFTLNLSQGAANHFIVESSNGSVGLLSGRSANVILSIKALPLARPGTYNLTVRISETGFWRIITVIVPEPGYAADSVNLNRYVEQSNSGNSTSVALSLYNTKNESVTVRIVETIPKGLAANASEITFGLQPEIIEADPVVAWEITLAAGERRELTYSVAKVSNESFTAPQLTTKQDTDVDTGNGTDNGEETTTEVSSGIIGYIIGFIVISAIIVVIFLYREDIMKVLMPPKKGFTPAFGKKLDSFGPNVGKKLDSFGLEGRSDKLNMPDEKKQF